MNPILSRLARQLIRALWLFETGLFLLLALLNLRYFAIIRPESGGKEFVEYQNDSILRFLPVFVLGAATVLFCAKLLEKLPPKGIALLLALVVGAVSCWWAANSGYVLKGDQNSVYTAACNLLQNNFCDLETGEYLFVFPFQLGFVALLEGLFRLFGSTSLVPFMALSAAANVGIYLLLWGIASQFILHHTNPPARLAQTAAVLITGCLAGILPVNFVYGNLLGSFFGLLAVWLLLCWQKNGRLGLFAGGCLAMAAAVQMKLFNLIFLIALCIFLVLEALHGQKPAALALAVVLALGCAVWQGGLEKIYEARMGRPLPQSYPMALTLAMGMQDNWEGWRAPGWCNTYNYSVYEESGYNRDIAAQRARQDIQNRLGEFASEPAKALKFYKFKTLSQWTEPTYQGFWTEYDWFNPGKYTGLLASLYTGPLQTALVRGMKWYQTAVWVLAFLCLAASRRRMGPAQLLPGLIVLGGFLFSLISEGKGQYTLPYFLLAIPYAAAGLALIPGLLGRLYHLAGSLRNRM